jgi:hypothetical protein
MSPELTSNLTMVKHLERLLAMIESLESTSGKLQKLVANAHSSIDLLEARLGMTSDGVPNGTQLNLCREAASYLVYWPDRNGQLCTTPAYGCESCKDKIDKRKGE